MPEGLSRAARRLLTFGSVQEIVQFPFRLVPSMAVPFLQFADHFLRIALNLRQIVIREFAPLRANIAFQLRPLSFKDICVH